MGYPFFTWLPHMVGRTPKRETILLSEDLSDLQVQPKRDVADAFSISGGRSRELLRPWIDLRIVYDRFNDRKLFRQFSAMINHLERGGAISFGVDSSKAYMNRLTTDHYQDGPKLHLGKIDYGYAPSAYTPATLSSGGEIVIESGPPSGKREYHTIDAHTGDALSSAITFAESLDLFDNYPAGSVVRYSDFYPILIMGPGQVGGAHLTHEHRITYTLDILLSTIQPTPDPDNSPQGGDSDK